MRQEGGFPSEVADSPVHVALVRVGVNDNCFVSRRMDGMAALV